MKLTTQSALGKPEGVTSSSDLQICTRNDYCYHMYYKKVWTKKPNYEHFLLKGTNMHWEKMQALNFLMQRL